MEEREFLSISLIKELDQKVFRKSWNGLEIVQGKSEPGLPDGIKILWNNRLRNTAGRAKWERSVDYLSNAGEVRLIFIL